jgi:6-phosphogluconolactonase (cycloisomerase 2 family)
VLLALTACALLFGCGDTSSDKVSTAEAPQYIYVANNGNGTISAFSLDAGNGALTELDGSPFASAPGASKLVADPGGHFLYVVSDSSNKVYGHKIDPATGELSDAADSPFSVAPSPKALKVDPSGSYLYIVHAAATKVISFYEIDAANGDLTQIPGSPVNPGGTGALALTIHPGGHYLYAADMASNSIYGYAIHTGSGSLAKLLGSPFAAGTQPKDLAADPTGRFIFASDDDAAVRSLYVGSVSGDLGATTPDPITVGPAVTLAAGPTGEYLYAAGGTDLHAMTIRGDGVLENLQTQAAGTDLAGIALDASGVFLYATDNAADVVLGFSLKESGNLPVVLSTSPVPVGPSPMGIAAVQVQAGK